MPMSRKLKCVGLAVVAALAFASVSVSAAAAEPLFHKTNAGLKVLNGKQTLQVVFSIPEGDLICEVATFATETEFKTVPDLTVSAKYEKCEFGHFGKNSAAVNMNGCNYVFDANGEMDIVCPLGKTIVVSVKPAGVTKCTVTIPEQLELKGIEYINEVGGTWIAKLTVEEIDYTTHEGTGAGSCQATGNGVNGIYNGGITFTASGEAIWVE